MKLKKGPVSCAHFVHRILIVFCSWGFFSFFILRYCGSCFVFFSFFSRSLTLCISSTRQKLNLANERVLLDGWLLTQTSKLPKLSPFQNNSRGLFPSRPGKGHLGPLAMVSKGNSRQRCPYRYHRRSCTMKGALFFTHFTLSVSCSSLRFR